MKAPNATNAILVCFILSSMTGCAKDSLQKSVNGSHNLKAHWTAFSDTGSNRHEFDVIHQKQNYRIHRESPIIRKPNGEVVPGKKRDFLFDGNYVWAFVVDSINVSPQKAAGPCLKFKPKNPYELQYLEFWKIPDLDWKPQPNEKMLSVDCSKYSAFSVEGLGVNTDFLIWIDPNLKYKLKQTNTSGGVNTSFEFSCTKVEAFEAADPDLLTPPANAETADRVFSLTVAP